MNRTQQILVGVLVVQIVLAVALFWPRSAPTSAGGAPLLGLKAEDITSLTLRDSQGDNVKLAKSGAQWVLPAAGDYPADATKIVQAIAELVEMKADRLVVETPAAHKRLQVADDSFARRIDVETSSGTKTVYLGTSGGVGSTYVRLEGQNQVYLVSGLDDWQLAADAQSWTNPVYFTVPQSDVVGMTLSNANGRFAFAKGSDGKWGLEGMTPGETVNPESVQGLLSTASYVTLAQPLGKTEDPAFGLSQPSAIVTLVTKAESGEKTYTLTVGSRDSNDKTYVIKSSESPYFVRVTETAVKDLVEKKREGFLALLPTAAPTTGAATPAPAP
jgi:hypothetical protein